MPYFYLAYFGTTHLLFSKGLILRFLGIFVALSLKRVYRLLFPTSFSLFFPFRCSQNNIAAHSLFLVSFSFGFFLFRSCVLLASHVVLFFPFLLLLIFLVFLSLPRLCAQLLFGHRSISRFATLCCCELSLLRSSSSWCICAFLLFCPSFCAKVLRSRPILFFLFFPVSFCSVLKPAYFNAPSFLFILPLRPGVFLVGVRSTLCFSSL